MSTSASKMVDNDLDTAWASEIDSERKTLIDLNLNGRFMVRVNLFLMLAMI